MFLIKTNTSFVRKFVAKNFPILFLFIFIPVKTILQKYYNLQQDLNLDSLSRRRPADHSITTTAQWVQSLKKQEIEVNRISFHDV